MTIHRGTEFKEKVNVRSDGIKVLSIRFCEGNKVVLSKGVEGAAFEDGKLVVTITAEETLKFTANAKVTMHLSVMLANGTFSLVRAGCVQ